MEKDALERSERRKKHINEAKIYKEKGNAEFKKENYLKAVEYYSKVNQINFFCLICEYLKNKVYILKILS